MKQKKQSALMMQAVFVSLLIILFYHTGAFGQTSMVKATRQNNFPNTNKPFIKNYYPIDYKGQNQMYDVVRDQRGVLYFGNNVSGVLEYDGIQWRTIALANNNTAYSLDVDKSGRVYVGGFGEIGYLWVEKGVSRYKSLMDYVPEKHRRFGPSQVKCIDDSAYFKAGDVILHWQHNAFSAIENKNGKGFENIFAIHNKIYTSDENGNIFRIEGDKPVVIFKEQPDIFDGYIFKNEYNMPSVNLMLPYDDHSILIGSYFRGLLIFDGERLDLFENEANELIYGNLSYAGTAFGEEFFAIGTVDRGVVIIDKQGKLRAWFDQNNGLINNGIFSLYADKQNFLWVGTSYGFSQILYPSPFSIYDNSCGIDGQVRMTAAFGDTLYVVTSKGAYRSRSGSSELGMRFERITRINPAETGVVKVFEDSVLIGSIFGMFQIENLGSALATTEPDITQFLNPGPDYSVRSFSPLHDKDCRFIAVSKKHPGIVYTAAVSDGLYVFLYQNGKWSQEGHIQIDDAIFFGQEDEAGILWITGVNTGMYRIDFSKGSFKNPEIKNYYTREGLPGGYYAISLVDKNVFLYSDEAFFKFDQEKDRFIPDTRFYADLLLTGFIDESPDGSVWITKGRPRRLSRAFRQKDHSYIRHKSPYQRFNNYQIRNFGYDHKGKTWFGADQSLLAFDPNVPFNHRRPYKTIIRKVFVHTKPIFGPDSRDILRDAKENPIVRTQKNIIQLNYDDNSLRFDFAGLYLDVEFENTYQVWLEGMSAHWTEWSAANYKEYSNLDPGKYRFHAKAKNLYATESDEAIFDFEIFSPWWETWWFYITEIGFLTFLLITSAILNRSGEVSRFAKIITFVTVVVVFESIMFLMEPVADNFGSGIPVVQLLVNVCLAMALQPAQEFVEGIFIARRQKRKYRVVFGKEGTWSGGAQIIPTLRDMREVQTWIDAFQKEFADIERKYRRYIANDWELDKHEKDDLLAEMEDLIGGLMIFRRHVTKDRPNKFSATGNADIGPYQIEIFPKYWRGEGSVTHDFEFSLVNFADWYQDLIKEILSILEAYKNAMHDNVLTDEERNILAPRIEKIFNGVLVVMNSIGAKGKGAY